ncbi:MAG: hypothetical protein Q9184_004437, partial [Pyrenodesmia sp. 2 TL-2023]
GYPCLVGRRSSILHGLATKHPSSALYLAGAESWEKPMPFAAPSTTTEDLLSDIDSSPGTTHEGMQNIHQPDGPILAANPLPPMLVLDRRRGSL